MQPFQFETPATLGEAATAIADEAAVALAGGTTVVDLMKLNVMTAKRVVSVAPLLDPAVSFDDGTLRIGAGCTMADLAAAPGLAERFPAVRHSLLLAASPQIRNMATLGGNLLQRTRLPYFRHTDMAAEGPDGGSLHKPHPARSADDERPFGEHADTGLAAVLGHGGRLVGTYPGDFAVVLLAFDGAVELSDGETTRTVAARDFYTLPAEGDVQYGTVLAANELITAITLPLGPAAAHSVYYKVRERSSYAFALASAAVGLEMDGETIRSARLALGGLGAIPWYVAEAVVALEGEPATDPVFERAADRLLAKADPPAGVEFKVPLAKRTIVRALQTLRDEGPPSDTRLWAQQHGRG